ICATDRVAAEPAAFDNPADLFSLAKVLENTAEWKRSRQLYEMALAEGIADPLRLRAAENLSVIYRRSGEHELALATCSTLMESSLFSMAGYEGAAIFYERIAEDLARALEVVELALSRLEQTPDQHKR